MFVYESTFGGFKNLMFKNLSHDKTPESCVGEVYVKQERHSVSSWSVWSYRELRIIAFIRTPSVHQTLVVPVHPLSHELTLRVHENSKVYCATQCGDDLDSVCFAVEPVGTS